MADKKAAQIPFLDIRLQNRRIWPELQEALDGVTSQGQFILGPAVERFETAFAPYVGRRYCVAVNSGTSALHMTLAACDVGPGDEVITTPHTWISTAWAISYVGARPVFADIDPTTYNIDPQQVRRAITPRTKAILPVHLYGRACEMDALGEIADEHGLTLIEDAAQAHGAVYQGRPVGSFGKAACYSFYPGKNLGAFGEGGAVVTDDEDLAERIRRLRDHAQDGRHRHVELGFNTRMEGIQGAVLDVKLRHLDQWNAARALHAGRYLRALGDVPELTLPEVPEVEVPGPGAHAWHLFVVLVPGEDRDRLQKELALHGIASGVHYPTPVPLQPAYADLGHQPGDFPVAEDVMQRCLSLPMFPELKARQIDRVAAVLGDLMEGASPREETTYEAVNA